MPRVLLLKTFGAGARAEAPSNAAAEPDLKLFKCSKTWVSVNLIPETEATEGVHLTLNQYNGK